jgi:hypothetical protein
MARPSGAVGQGRVVRRAALGWRHRQPVAKDLGPSGRCGGALTAFALGWLRKRLLTPKLTTQPLAPEVRDIGLATAGRTTRRWAGESSDGQLNR